MNIDLEHLHYWMCAIRDSKDSKRTLDAFWKGQIDSKVWLIENIKPFIKDNVDIEIHGGWVGVLASLLFQSKLSIRNITSIDIDPECHAISSMMNRLEEMQGRFEAVTADMCSVDIKADIIINTSCEHINQEQYETWLNKIPEKSLIVLQSNNYEIEEHVRTVTDLEEFIEQSGINVIWANELELPKYKRFMIVGKKL